MVVIVEAVATAEGWAEALGEEPQSLCERVVAAVAQKDVAGEATFLFTDDAELQGLNRQFRGQDKSTNVLAFPAPAGFGALGDVALALETVRSEAAAQGKTLSAHASHLIAHGFLHLLGYDHETEEEAEIMEARERAVLEHLGLPDPYEVRS